MKYIRFYVLSLKQKKDMIKISIICWMEKRHSDLMVPLHDSVCFYRCYLHNVSLRSQFKMLNTN